MKVAIASDHAGLSLKNEVSEWLKAAGHDVHDFGCHSSESCDYADFAIPLAKSVAGGEFERGVLVCGTGIGMSIAANRVRGARAAHCTEAFSARASREHNDANILALGERVVGVGLALDILKVWMETDFTGEERHARRIRKMDD